MTLSIVLSRSLLLAHMVKLAAVEAVVLWDAHPLAFQARSASGKSNQPALGRSVCSSTHGVLWLELSAWTLQDALVRIGGPLPCPEAFQAHYGPFWLE